MLWQGDIDLQAITCKIANVEMQVVKDEDKTEESQSPVIQTENSTLEIITKEEEEKEVHRDQETEISKNKNDRDWP